MDGRELEKAAAAKKTLESISDSFCTVKWKHATLNLSAGAVKSCCHLPFRKADSAAMENGFQLHDTELDREERTMMLKGQKPKDCSYCWWLEDRGQLSDRIVWSSKSWMSPFTEEIASRAENKAKNPSWLELNFSNLCNLKCSYCSPIFSSRWLQEIKEFGPYPTEPRHNNLKYLSGVELDENFDNTKLLEKFWPWFSSTYPGLRLLKVTGGEPLINDNLFRVLDYVLDHPNSELNFSVNSNLTIPPKLWNKFLERITMIKDKNSIANFYLHPSIDTFGARAEYIRNGLNFSDFTRNVESYLEINGGNLVFICTLNNLALGGLLDLWKYLLDLKKRFGSRGQWVSMTSEVLIGPEWQNINILPDSFKQYLIDTISFAEANMGAGLDLFSKFEIQGLHRALDLMKAPPQHLDRARSNFIRFFDEHDLRRGTHLLEIFPEFENVSKEWRG